MKQSLRKLRPINAKRLLSLIILSLTLTPALLTTVTGHSTTMANYNDPLGSFSGTGQAPLFWSDNQKINNTSFENGNFQPWTTSSFNANASSVQIVSPGLNDNHAVQLSITSGNLTSSSYQRLTQDLTASQAAFSNDTLVQASVKVTSLTGNTIYDRAGVILSLASSTGNIVRLHYVFASGGTLPSNTTTDAYFKVAGFGSSGWISISRNLAIDTSSAFPSLASTINSVRDASLYVDSMSAGNPNRDPGIRFFDENNTGTWNTNDTVVYDSDHDGIYRASDPILWPGRYSPVADVSPVIVDPLTKFVDTNQNGVWDSGESVVYDCAHSKNPNDLIPGDCNNNIVDVNEPVINGNPIIGQLLMDPIRQTTTASFDNIQLYSPSMNGNILVNGGFETGTLSGWGNQAGFTLSSLAHTGSHSVLGSATGGSAQLAQSVDSLPRINSQSLFKASVYVSSLGGSTVNDTVDVSLGLSDSKGAPLSIYYVFDTGNSNIPSNSTGTIYYKQPGFGTVSQWINLNRTLSHDTSLFDSQGFSSPYSLNLVVLEARSQGSTASTAYFDDISYNPGLAQPGYAPSAYYATSGNNVTYTYIPSGVSTGAFSVQIPAGQTILNITTPTSTVLQASQYTIANLPPISIVSIPNSTATQFPLGGTYHVYTTSKNAVASINVEDATSLALLDLTTTLATGRHVDLVELTLDPFGSPISGANSTISIWAANGTMIDRWTGRSDNTGFYRVHNIALPTSDGSYTLQATTYSAANVGLRDKQLKVATPTGPSVFSPLVIALIIVAIIAGVTGFLIYYRRRKFAQVQKTQAAPPGKMKKNNGQKPRK